MDRSVQSCYTAGSSHRHSTVGKITRIWRLLTADKLEVRFTEPPDGDGQLPASLSGKIPLVTPIHNSGPPSISENMNGAWALSRKREGEIRLTFPPTKTQP
jgi:hypothetical protein